MIPSTVPVAGTDAPVIFNPEIRFHRSLCWKAILAGATTAIGIHLLLLALGAGIGLATFAPLTDQNPSENFSIGSAIAWSVCALISLYVGGGVAGCFSAGPKTAGLHGIVVWSMTMIITFTLVSTGGGLVLGGAVKALGSGLGMAGQAALGGVTAGGANELTKANDKKGMDQISSFIDEATQGSTTNAANNSTGTNLVSNARAKREIGFAVTKLFSPDNDASSADNQKAVVQALTKYGGMNEADAQKMVNEWLASYQELKAELDHAKKVADQKAREAAEKAAEKLAKAATITFFALLAGLIVTVCGGICGARRTYRHTTVGRLSIDPTF
jgi:hypothetical protein